MSVNQNNAKVIASCNQRLTALRKHVTNSKTPMKIGGQTMKVADVIGVFQAAIDTRTTLVELRAAYEKALADRDSADATRVATDDGLRGWVQGEFGPRSTQAQEFGFRPRKVAKTSVATKAGALEQSAATRTARGTMGKRQREKIKGTVVAPTEPVAPATTTPAAPPAASVPATSNGAPASAPATNGAATPH